jgi:tRNA pseudouridine13 synthase
MFSWARAHGDPPICGDLRLAPEDFRVTEKVAIDFTGDGEHDWLWIEKRAANTAWVAKELARFAAVTERDVSYAGLKDRHAVTRQWFSVRRNSGSKLNWDLFAAPGVQLLRQTRHLKKLRRGAHSGNEFEIILRNIKYLDNNLEARLDAIKATGVPNYFGEQRFGRSGSNLQQARDLFAGKRLKRSARSLALSAARSYLFNRVLDTRVRDGSWNCILAGDCANLDGSNSVFRVTDVDDELRDRCRNMDIHPSGPLWGRGESMADGPIAALEQAVADEEQDLAHGLENWTRLARRPLRIALRQMTWDIQRDDLRLSFELPSGAYATTVLGELADYSDRSLPDRHAAHGRSSNT